ncbi:diguanylate cyclase [Pseudoduganella buxea]|uniref:diguanylate cyclase n=1 Tax=Pseudoduganella buxea TaxID=1949069 RepID=A0A6I3T196_9BURK|nr:diguanylate cyclase [Pseudoduganella buxea]MTV55243.1 diguanylate cyclase [Pseudoduganella buxea]GGB94894.1 GGDEF domain-containing protein [Pseudoduganella buxea]
MPAEVRIRKIAIAAIVASAIVAAVPFFVSSRVTEGVTLLKRAADRQNLYIDLLSMLRDVETSQRGFVLSGREAFLDPYNVALVQIPVLKRNLIKGAIDAEEREALDQIIPLTDEKLVNAAEGIAARRNHDATADSAVGSTSLGKVQMDKLRQLLGQQISAMADRRNNVRGTLIEGSAQVAYFSGLAAVINTFLLGTAVFGGRRLLRERAKVADQLRAAVTLADTRNQLMSGSARMLQAIQSAPTVGDTSAILTTCLTGLLPGVSGTLYLYRNSPDVLEPLASWGSADAAAVPIPREDCWALRFGRAHDHCCDHDLRCNHLRSETRTQHLCLPMVTQGAVIGMMSVRFDSLSTEQFATQRELVMALAEQVSLALSNVQLREALRAQSIIDPLTDLYNRRFLEETLKRELARSTRNKSSLSVIMFDVDHFKHLNDTYGHDAGDTVLKAVAAAAKGAVRKADIVCRYGGEEMIVVMPDCAEGMAMERAEMIRRAIESMRTAHGGRDMPQVTASFGVASHPVFGVDGDSLVRAADAALYVAKRRGRNNVQLAVEG